MVEPTGRVYLMPATTPIEHVVIVVKENHGLDNYFGTFPGVNGMAMAHSPNPPPSDPDHRHPAWLTRATTAARVQFLEADIPTYWAWARSFTLCDSYFTDVAGPSTPNHLMLVAADSPIIENPHPAPLFDLPTLPAQLDKAGLSWADYGGYVFDYLKYTFGKNKMTPDQFAIDAAAGKLPTVSWLYADDALSEHPADTAAQRRAGAGDVTKGSAWTALQVAAIVKGGLWSKVAIFVTWDDWGGWYDHVNPPAVEKWTDGTQFRYGGRVPCLVLSPYAKASFISHAQHSHVSLVRFCENAFGLPSLNARTAADDGMADCFDFKQAPLPPPA
jgi:phospholipase C